ncbi:MAG TPA: thiamine pyrophosphate-binding protein [Streptosporangiaceae bacterium]|jgi:thiamine pyrophosphate-dependent acetolactate synthase large subunit-like protein|nr:thiamine pyrophosphate-binding protein [Streptosporangiaceae bacterium]
MLVSEAIGAALAGLGADTVFGVVGSGNFHVTNALVAHGARFVAARHENGAACMADGWARLAGRPGILSVHQGPGLTNAITGITEAAKSRTPMLVLAADVAAAAVRSNFRIDVASLTTAVGATPERLHSPETAVADLTRAYATADRERRTVVLALPLDIQAGSCDGPGAAGVAAAAEPAAVPGTIAASVTGAAAIANGAPPAETVEQLAAALAGARRPVFIAGRGARHGRAGPALARLAAGCGALLATSAAAKGLFRGSPWDLDVSGGFATPLAAELIRDADLVVGWGCALNMWTLRHGQLIGPDATVVQVDNERAALGAHRTVDLAVLGGCAATAEAAEVALAKMADQENGAPGPDAAGYRTAEVAARIAAEGRWRDVPYEDDGDAGHIDPRTLSIVLDDLLPAERVVAIDSGNFMGYPSMFLSVPDADGFTFTQAYQSIGLGLASAIGAAIARPDRLTVAALGDGGALMGVSELETAVRLGLGMVIVIYDDEAYGAEVHHFGPDGHPLDTVRFPPADIAAIGRGFGCDALTVRGPDDLAPVRDWLAGPRSAPLVIDAKVTSHRGSWWLEEAFRGH